MKVNLVSSLSFNGSSKVDKVKLDKPQVLKTNSVKSDLAKVPMVVLLAMNPVTLNSAIPYVTDTNNSDKVVVMAPDKKSVNKSTYSSWPGVNISEQTAPPFGWKIFSTYSDNIKDVTPCKCDGQDYYMVYTGEEDDKKTIQEVYFVKKGARGALNNSVAHPPRVKKIIYHNLGPNSFCSVVTLENLIGDDFSNIGTAKRELKLDDVTAQKLIDMLSGETNWINGTHIVANEVYNASVLEPKAVYF